MATSSWASWCPCYKRPVDLAVFETPAPAAKAVPVPRPTTRRSNALKDNVGGGGPSDGRGTPEDAVEGSKVDTRVACAKAARGTAIDTAEHVLSPDVRSDEKAAATTELAPASGSIRYDLVLLYTQVQNLEGHEDMYTCKGCRLDGVYTKLHALSLVKYGKVLMMKKKHLTPRF